MSRLSLEVRPITRTGGLIYSIVSQLASLSLSTFCNPRFSPEVKPDLRLTPSVDAHYQILLKANYTLKMPFIE